MNAHDGHTQMSYGGTIYCDDCGDVIAAVYGRRPIGRATGDERWAVVTDDDGTQRITAYRGWTIVAEVTVNGENRDGIVDVVLAGYGFESDDIVSPLHETGA